jgi:hypothetical protein
MDEIVKYSPTGCSASKSNSPTEVPLYQISSYQIRAMRSWGFRGSARIASGVVQDTVDQAGIGPAIGGPLDALAFLNDHDFGPRVSLLGICWPERSNGLDSESAAPIPRRFPDAPNPNACDSARKSPALRRKFYCPPSPCERRLTAWMLFLILASFEDNIEAADQCIALQRLHCTLFVLLSGASQSRSAAIRLLPGRSSSCAVAH